MTTTLRIDPGRLRAARVAAALTQSALASRAGIRHTTVSNLERGTRPARLSTIRRIADALDVPVQSIADVVPADTPTLGVVRAL